MLCELSRHSSIRSVGGSQSSADLIEEIAHGSEASGSTPGNAKKNMTRPGVGPQPYWSPCFETCGSTTCAYNAAAHVQASTLVWTSTATSGVALEINQCTIKNSG